MILIKNKTEHLIIVILGMIFLLSACNNGKEEIKSYSTIDLEMQRNIQELMDESIIAGHNDWACVVVMESQTGEIKASVNVINSDDKAVSEMKEKVPDFAATQLVLPGHLFAFVSLIACVEDAYIDIQDIVVRSKEEIFYDFIIRDIENYEKDTVSILSAFKRKSNTAIARIVHDKYKDNPDKFIQRLNQFDLDKPLGIRWINESTPIISKPNSNNWSNESLPMLSIGYGSKHTPLQLLAFYNAFLNNGEMLLPVNEKSDTITLPVILNQNICSYNSIDAGLKLLENQTYQSDSMNIHYFGHSTVALELNEIDGTKNYQAISVAFYPAENPKYSCIFVVNSNSEKIYYNPSLELMNRVFSYFTSIN
jgi:cell division protein FtsI (penicillin-binding protein 3)